jgi:hypothetical protein
MLGVREGKYYLRYEDTRDLTKAKVKGKDERSKE